MNDRDPHPLLQGNPGQGLASTGEDAGGVCPELRAQNEALQATLECMDSAVFAVDRAYRYTNFNRAHASIMKAIYGAEIELGKSLLGYQTVPEDRLKAQANLDRALAGERVVEEAFSGESPESRMYFEVTHHPIRKAQGECTGVVVVAKDITRQRQAMDARVESETRFRTIFEQAGVGVVSIDPSTGCFQQVNQRFCDLMGYTGEELKTMGFQSITHPEDLGASLSLMQRLNTGELPGFNIEKRYVRKDGAMIWADLTVSKLLLAAGKPESTLAVVQDISARKAADKALLESHHLIQELLDHSPALIYVADLQGRFLRINKQFETVLNRAKGEVIGMTWAGLLAQEAASAHAASDRAVTTSGTASMFEETHLTGEGDRNYLTIKFPLLDDQGQPYALCGISTDITERTLAEEATVNREALLRTVMENTPENVVLLDLRGRIQFMNHCEPGLDPAQVEGANWIDWVEESQRHVVQGVFDRCLAEQSIFEHEYQAIGPRGELTWYRVTFAPVSHGTFGAVLLLARNVTESRLAGEAIRNQLEELRRWHDATLDRESRILTLKEEVNELLLRQGGLPRYTSVLAQEHGGAP